MLCVEVYFCGFKSNREANSASLTLGSLTSFDSSLSIISIIKVGDFCIILIKDNVIFPPFYSSYLFNHKVIEKELSEAKGQGYGSEVSSHHDLVPQFFNNIFPES